MNGTRQSFTWSHAEANRQPLTSGCSANGVNGQGLGANPWDTRQCVVPRKTEMLPRAASNFSGPNAVDEVAPDAAESDERGWLASHRRSPQTALGFRPGSRCTAPRAVYISTSGKSGTSEQGLPPRSKSNAQCKAGDANGPAVDSGGQPRLAFVTVFDRRLAPLVDIQKQN